MTAETMYDPPAPEETVIEEASSGVHRAMHAVQAELASTGIAKSRENQQQGYRFRGIDEAYDAVAPLLAKHKLLMIPRILERNVVERISSQNKALFYVTVKAEYDFVAVEDGSTQLTGPFFGEAMDSGDKATNKAMSSAHKYAIFETFCIPIQGTPDADLVTYEVLSNLTADQTGFLTKLKAAAAKGIPALEEAWKTHGNKDDRLALARLLEGLKEEAQKVGNAA